jgi:protein subunit release factor A
VALPSRGGRPVSLDPEQLLDEARTWGVRWEPLFAESRLREAEAASLIDESAKDGFWDDAAHAQDVLRRYKMLDARLQADRRLLRAPARLARALEHEADLSADELAQLVHQAATSYRRWLDIGSETGPGAAWLVLGPADSVLDCAEWLTDLVAMYRGWFRRRGLQYELVAEEVERGQPVRLVFEVEGPGVLGLLEMEAGEHRRRAASGVVERALVEVIPRRDGPVDERGVVEDARRTRGVAITQRAARARIDLPRRGLRLKLYGTSRETLSMLARDLGAAMATPSDGGAEVVRTYGLRGGAVHDPRTSASTANLKDVLRGNLEVFRRAWEVR